MGDTTLYDDFLATKLYVPVLRSDAVSRERLLLILHKGLQARLTLICAPAGFGKTTLLSEWLNSLNKKFPHEYTVAWVSLDKEDDDASRFWLYIFRALGIVPQRVPEGHTWSTPAMKHVLTWLINSISRKAENIILVLDDYHVISEAAIHEGMMFLLHSLPPNVHVVIASRAHLPFPLARLRTQEEIVELYTESLRFTRQETNEYVRRKHRIKLSDRDIIALESRMEGWIAGLQLATFSIHDRKDLSDFLRNVSGNHRFIFEYVLEEVFTRLPEEVQSFLLATSILSAMCVPLCDAVAQQHDSQRILEYLEQANVFIVPLDDRGYWYRYHHLFSEALYHHLQHTRPALLLELHRRACLWYEQNGQKDEAIKHALAIGDFEKAACLLESIGETLLRQGEIISLGRRLEQLPEATIQSHPLLLMLQFWLLISIEHQVEAESCLERLERILHESSTLRFNVGLKVARSFLAQSKGELALSISLVQSALALVRPEDYGQRCYMQLHLAKSLWLNGNLAGAKQALLEGLRVSEPGGYNYFIVLSWLELAYLQFIQGQLTSAYTGYQRALKIVEEQKGSTLLLAGTIHVGLSLVCYEKNDLSAAQDHLIASIKHSQEIGDTHTLFHSTVLLARVKLSMGNTSDAHEMIQEIDVMSASPATFFPFTCFIDYYSSIHLALGNIERATAVLEENASAHMPPLLQSEEQIAHARCLQASSQFDVALDTLEPALHQTQEQGNTRGLIKSLLLRALIYWKQHNINVAVADIAHALSLAESKGFIRTFLDEGEPLKELLSITLNVLQKDSYTVSHTVSPAYLTHLLASSTKKPLYQNNAISDAQPQVNLLSERELEVLHLIALGKSNQEIAEQLVIANSTLKTHINRMYSKLAVRSRTQAIVQARKLHLLQNDSE